MSTPHVHQGSAFYPQLFEHGGAVPVALAIGNPAHPYETTCPMKRSFTVVIDQLNGNKSYIYGCFCCMTSVSDVAKIAFEHCIASSRHSKKLLAYKGIEARFDQKLEDIVKAGQEITFHLLEVCKA